MTRLLAAFLLLLAAAAATAEVRPFVAGSLRQIESERAGKAFVVTLWSAGCTHCPGELRTLGELRRKHPGLDIVLVATDTPAETPQLEQLARDYGLGRAPQWVFAADAPERLRFEIDRRWYGELPRTYFYDAGGRRQGRSGVVPAAELERWVAENVK